jgi:Flp pilus assembly protein TadD
MLAVLLMSAWAAVASAQPPAVSTAAVSYSAGMDARKRGDHAEALRIFTRLSRDNPKNAGAWEGLALTDISLARYEDALDAVKRWEKNLGKGAYAESIAARARAGIAAREQKASAPSVEASTASAAARKAAAAPSAPPAPLEGYSLGMAQRASGDNQAAFGTFSGMLSRDPASGGALEGLTLTSIGLGRFDQALQFAERWQAQGDSAYIESQKARIYGRLGRRDEAADALVKTIRYDPADVRAGRRLDALLRSDAPGVFPAAGVSKTISIEGLGTPTVSRIIYEGRNGGAAARFRLRPGFNAVAGAVVTQTAQRNDSVGFTYFDILEQVYSGGLEYRGRHQWGLAQYGQSALSDNKGSGVGRVNFSRVKAQGGFDRGDLEVRGFLERAPYFLRGAGGSHFFALLREDSARVEVEERFLGLGWLARGTILDYSDQVTVNSEALTATKEGGRYLVAATASHSYQEFFGAGADGKLAVMPYDSLGVRGQYGLDGEWLAALSYSRAHYRDGNRENTGGAGLRWWVPKTGDAGLFWLSYRFDIDEFLNSPGGYRANDARAHWAGPFWKRQFGGGPWVQLGYEHGWIVDTQGSYEGNRWTAELEWYHTRSFSLVSQGRLAHTTIGTKSQGADIQARWTF